MPVKMNMRGLVPAVFTPFNDDLSLNLSLIPKYVEHLHNSNIKGVLVNGTTGEGMSMNVDERKASAETWLREARKYGIHVMVQVGGAPLPDVIELAKHAESIKADAILTLPELFYKPKTIAEAVSYLRLVSDAAPNTPILYYHNPGLSDVHLYMPDLVDAAKKEIKNFRGLKFTSTDLKEANCVLKACGNDCVVFLGADPVLIAAVALGYDSSIGTTYNMFSHLAFGVTTNVRADKDVNIVQARNSQRDLNFAINSITAHGKWVESMKAAMAMLTGVNVGPVRPPLKRFTPAQLATMNADLQKQGFKLK